MHLSSCIVMFPCLNCSCSVFLKVGVKLPVSLPVSPFNCLEFQTKLFSGLKNDVRRYLHSVEAMRADDGSIMTTDVLFCEIFGSSLRVKCDVIQTQEQEEPWEVDVPRIPRPISTPLNPKCEACVDQRYSPFFPLRTEGLSYFRLVWVASVSAVSLAWSEVDERRSCLNTIRAQVYPEIMDLLSWWCK